MAIIDDYAGIAKGMKGDLKPPAKPPSCIVCFGSGLAAVGRNTEPCRFCEEGLKQIPDAQPAEGWSRPLCHACNGRGADTYGNICQRCFGKGHS